MFLLKILLLVMIAGALTSIFTFVADVWKWHDKEEKVIIIPSADEPEEKEVKEEPDEPFKSEIQ